MTEAMSAGLPVVAYESCSSANHIILNEVNGILVKDGVEGLAERLRRLMVSKELRYKIGGKAHNSMKKYDSMKKYAPDNVWSQWESLIQKTADHHRRFDSAVLN